MQTWGAETPKFGSEKEESDGIPELQESDVEMTGGCGNTVPGNDC